MKVEIKCKHCKGQNFRKEGIRKTDNREEYKNIIVKTATNSLQTMMDFTE